MRLTFKDRLRDLFPPARPRLFLKSSTSWGSTFGTESVEDASNSIIMAAVQNPYRVLHGLLLET